MAKLGEIKPKLIRTNIKRGYEIGPRNFAARRNPERNCGLYKFFSNFKKVINNQNNNINSNNM